MKKILKTLVSIVLTIIASLSAINGSVLAEEGITIPVFEETDYDRLITDIPEDADLETIINLENRNFKHIQALKPIMEETSYKVYSKAVNTMKKERTVEAVNAALEARAALIEEDKVEDRILFIWDGTTMPVVDGEEFTEEDIDSSQMFGYGFEPFAITYLLDDQTQAKGNIIAVSGGGFLVWSNGSEGYPAAQVFNDLGYNYFLLQRRVGPYSDKDVFMDYNRYVKVVKKYAMEHDLGGQDMFAGLGWSGGGGTIFGGAINDFYGTINASIYDSDYVPDETDAISGDLDVAMIIYGTADGRTITSAGENNNLPAFYFCVGTEDVPTVDTTKAAYDLAVELGLPAELYIVEGAPHGFGVGLRPANGAVPGTELWPAQADAFMQENLGHSSKGQPESQEDNLTDESAEAEGIYFPDAPEEFVKAKEFYGYYILMDSEVIFALNEDETRFAVQFYGMGGKMPTFMMGDVHPDGTIEPDLNFNGLYGEDLQTMYEDALEEEADWAPIIR